MGVAGGTARTDQPRDARGEWIRWQGSLVWAISMCCVPYASWIASSRGYGKSLGIPQFLVVWKSIIGDEPRLPMRIRKRSATSVRCTLPFERACATLHSSSYVHCNSFLAFALFTSAPAFWRGPYAINSIYRILINLFLSRHSNVDSGHIRVY